MRKSVLIFFVELFFSVGIHGTDIEENNDQTADKELVSLYNVLNKPTRPVGCAVQDKSWDQAMDCIECGLNSCVNQCRAKEQLPVWFKTCYDKTQWTSVFDDLTQCLKDKSDSCIRLPPLTTVLKAFDKKQIQDNKLLTNLQNKVTMNDIACFGVCAFSGTVTCMKKCDRFNGTSYAEHPASSCFEINKSLLNTTVNQFLTCINQELE